MIRFMPMRYSVAGVVAAASSSIFNPRSSASNSPSLTVPDPAAACALRYDSSAAALSPRALHVAAQFLDARLDGRRARGIERRQRIVVPALRQLHAREAQARHDPQVGIAGFAGNRREAGFRAGKIAGFDVDSRHHEGRLVRVGRARKLARDFARDAHALVALVLPERIEHRRESLLGRQGAGRLA
jgi:hypothetical protein